MAVMQDGMLGCCKEDKAYSCASLRADFRLAAVYTAAAAAGPTVCESVALLGVHEHLVHEYYRHCARYIQEPGEAICKQRVLHAAVLTDTHGGLMLLWYGQS